MYHSWESWNCKSQFGDMGLKQLHFGPVALFLIQGALEIILSWMINENITYQNL